MGAARTFICLAGCAAWAIVGTGCIERTIHITSEPPGAMVWVNDVEVGRTPVDVEYEWEGAYDVRVMLEGYEAVWEKREVKGAAHDFPGVDLVATVAPARFRSETSWHFELRAAQDDVDGLLERGTRMRERAEGPAGEEAPR
ncbi:MAG: PEGA domain-containing protein [Phycisphaerales bacterium]